MRRAAGFTLLEVLVAVALLAMLGLAAALTLNSGLRSQQTLSENLSSLQRLQLAQQLIQRDLEQIVARRGRGEQGDFRDQPLAAGEDGTLLDFYKTGRRQLQSRMPGSDLEHLRYRFEDGHLVRDATPLIDTPPDTPWHSVTLLDQLNGVELRYFYDGDWIDQWPPVRAATFGGHVSRLPLALELTLNTERYGAVTQIMLLPDAS
ncbi:type II secretion system minor pseudopilin GspJ [Marinobacterium rhizophilum]|uniref:type II secretion system minor pseudopilin GspJ n=1 Tax=Marinobacterium rhizophilum TaxID=420402 RepID=UPI000375DEBD|nr:type II secretion system minor pseudopilin GspJ [Marinobacterium rhizophilum]